jgi:hypothetical protein
LLSALELGQGGRAAVAWNLGVSLVTYEKSLGGMVKQSTMARIKENLALLSRDRPSLFAWYGKPVLPASLPPGVAPEDFAADHVERFADELELVAMQLPPSVRSGVSTLVLGMRRAAERIRDGYSNDDSP